MQKRDQDKGDPISIKSEQDLRRRIRAICLRFNADPELSRLLLVNPILAFEDAGVALAPEMRQHVMEALRFPPKLRERIARLEGELQQELGELGEGHALPLDGKSRAALLFRTLKLEPLAEDKNGDIGAARLRAYADRHPLIAKLAEYERARQGALPFQPRHVYDAYKEGRQRHRWIRAVRFKV